MPYYNDNGTIRFLADGCEHIFPDAILISDEDGIRLQAEQEASVKANLPYGVKRAMTYLPVEAQLDMQYHDAIDGTTKWRDYITSVKAQFPKPV